MTLEGNKIVERKKEEDIIIDEPVEDTAELQREQCECPECGHNECYVWYAQVPMAESVESKFYKCVKCGHKWREMDDTTDY